MYTNFNRLFSSTSIKLAGHSHWRNVQHIKGANDAAKSVMTGRLTVKISNCVRRNGPDTLLNEELKQLLSQARNLGIPKSTLESTIKKATADREQTADTIICGMTGVKGYNLLIEAAPNKLIRFNEEMTHIAKRNNLKYLPPTNSIAHLYAHKGVLRIPAGPFFKDVDNISDEEETAVNEVIEELALLADCENFYLNECIINGLIYTLICGAETLNKANETVCDIFSRKDGEQIKNLPLPNKLSVLSVSQEYIPLKLVELEEEYPEKMQRILNLITDNLSVLDVYDNSSNIHTGKCKIVMS